MSTSIRLVSGLTIYYVLLAMLLAMLLACATSPTTRTKNAGVYFKATVDGLGNGYLEYCEAVRRPSCIAKNAQSEEVGTPMTEEQRIACLRPCNSATASDIRTAVDVVRGAQTVLFHLLVKGNATTEELAMARAQLIDAVEALATVLDERGVTDMLKEAVEG